MLALNHCITDPFHYLGDIYLNMFQHMSLWNVNLKPAVKGIMDLQL